MDKDSSSLEVPVQCTDKSTGQADCTHQHGLSDHEEDEPGYLNEDGLDINHRHQDETRKLLERAQKMFDGVLQQGRDFTSREIKLYQHISQNANQIRLCFEKLEGNRNTNELKMDGQSLEIERLKKENSELSSQVDKLKTELEEVKGKMEILSGGMMKKEDVEEKLANLKMEMNEELKQKDDQIRQLTEEFISFKAHLNSKIKSLGASGNHREGGIHVNPVFNLPVMNAHTPNDLSTAAAIIGELAINRNGDVAEGATSMSSDSTTQSRSNEPNESGFEGSHFFRSTSEPYISVHDDARRRTRARRGQRRDCLVM